MSGRIFQGNLIFPPTELEVSLSELEVFFVGRVLLTISRVIWVIQFSWRGLIVQECPKPHLDSSKGTAMV